MAFRPAQRPLLTSLLGTVALFTLVGFRNSQSNLQQYFHHQSMSLGNMNYFLFMDEPSSSSPPSSLSNVTATTTTKTTTTTTLFDQDDVRSWGCARTETPAIYIHVGKMGGGTVRARFAAAALNYNRTHWHNSSDTTAYYAIHHHHHHHDGDGSHNDNTTTTTTQQPQRGYFCNSGLHNYRYHGHHRTFEGTHICRALSPVGHAIACPGTARDSFGKCHGCPIDGAACHRIYAGHNLLGNEMHHLPPHYLLKWWKTMWDGSNDDDSSSLHATTTTTTTNSYSSSLTDLWHLLQVDNRAWCPMLHRARPETFGISNRFFDQCAVPLGQHVDRVALQWAAASKNAVWQRRRRRRENDNSNNNNNMTSNNKLESSSLLDWDLLSFNWGPIYASLPVLRTIVVREPFGWLLSKYAWHRHAQFYICQNVTAATYRPYQQAAESSSLPHYPPTKALGWAHNHALYYLLQICGEDCQVRWEHAVATLGDSFTVDDEKALLDAMEKQADYNLRYSIAVVGIQDDMDGFYDMVSARVAYLNMSRNAHVEGPRHPSNPTEDCKAVFDSSNFQQAMMKASPAIAAIVRLHETAVQVHAFQRRELENNCDSP